MECCSSIKTASKVRLAGPIGQGSGYAGNNGSERRVLLLHGPVGSSKSTIARLLKQGLERYSRTEEGALYTFGWKEEDGTILWDPMNGDPDSRTYLSDSLVWKLVRTRGKTFKCVAAYFQHGIGLTGQNLELMWNILSLLVMSAVCLVQKRHASSTPAGCA